MCGNIKVANRGTLLGSLQAAEYISGLNLYRRAFAYLSCVQIISGAIGAFRKDALVAVGGYSVNTLVEDMDLTIALSRAGYEVAYCAEAVAYTEAPESLRALLKQRHRWMLGNFEVLGKHGDILFRKRYRRMGMLGLPYFLIAPIFNVFGSLTFLYLLFSVLVGGISETYIAPLILMLMLHVGLFLYALFLDREDARLLFVSLLDPLWYAHLMSFVYVRAAVAYFRGQEHSWDKLARLGKNVALARG